VGDGPLDSTLAGDVARSRAVRRRVVLLAPDLREFIDYKTSMITNEDPLRGLVFY